MTTLPPVIFALGRNYADHAAEMYGAMPERPIVFMKNPSAVIADGDEIVIPTICDEHGPQVDFEGELAVIIDRDCRDVAEAEALSYVRGYAAANDVSARWWQKEGSGGQYIRGKSFDTFCPVGTMIVASDVPDPQSLRLVTKLNGEVMQDAHTSDMIFPVAWTIAELSRGMTLPAGAVILTGTPGGVGAARTPPRFLQSGDLVKVLIEGVGSVTNSVRHEHD